MARFTYDTNVFIKHKPTRFPNSFVMSAVVIQELAAGAIDNSELQALNAVRRDFEEQGRLLVPTSEDWWLAGKVLNSLLRGSKPRRGKRAQRISKAEQQRIVRDVLIARTAHSVGATVVTYNIADFEKIRPYCAVRVRRPGEFPIQ